VIAFVKAASYWLTSGLVVHPIEPPISTKQSILENLRILFLLAELKHKQTVCPAKTQ
jgi:hypothetical protein